MRISRFGRGFLGLVGGAVMALASAGAALADGKPAAGTHGQLFSEVIAQARALAARPYRGDAGKLPAALEALDYSAYRDIRFRKKHALWGDAGNFSVEFFHPGFLFRHPVAIHEVVDGTVRTVAFDPAHFDYGNNDRPAELPTDLGFAGFRVHFPVREAGYDDELIAFLGASYFRMVGRGQHYGLSARGLAVDTALSSGEEFPRFVAFWLERPAPEARRMRLYALLDSPSVSGAYAFELESGRDTLVEIEAHLFARRDIERLGIAPLTSMFAWGENSSGSVDDYRPEVHDSDGLLQHTGDGEWIFRPLVNPPRLQTTSLLDPAPRGFGLLQRDRDFDHYQDAEALYHRRPGFWVEPLEGDWGSGALQLVEIPSPDETNDNVVAYWVSEQAVAAGDSRRYRYRLRTVADLEPAHGLARVVATRNGWGWIPGSQDPPPKQLRQFAVDFEGGALTGLGASQRLDARLEVRGGRARDVTVSRLPECDVWRVAFKLAPDDRAVPVDLRLFLELHGARVTETWTYLWDPTSVVSS